MHAFFAIGSGKVEDSRMSSGCFHSDFTVVKEEVPIKWDRAVGATDICGQASLVVHGERKEPGEFSRLPEKLIMERIALIGLKEGQFLGKAASGQSCL
jgi:hypothetical protein